eukprot:6034210-Pyramimonas_sp.AAC.1
MPGGGPASGATAHGRKCAPSPCRRATQTSEDVLFNNLTAAPRHPKPFPRCRRPGATSGGP